ISPTRFHNSVQNAASGYWSIAMRSRAPTTAVSGLDGVFATALLEAAVQAVIEAREVLLVAYDLPLPLPMRALHPVADGAGVALVLAPAPGPGTLATLVIEVGAGHSTRIAAPALEKLRLSNPPMRALPLLLAVARGEDADVVLAADEANALTVTIHAARHAR
ncbi:MAG TPA: beta-ketoacyl synthase chain length factor, partial [Burkholderiales bacterium]|nr:beta-ketoacyl synthase chain length factor [Burkholderiales bacterium]